MQPRRSRNIVIVAAIVSTVTCAILGLFAYQDFMRGCLCWDCAPVRNFRTLDLDVPQAFFPSGVDYHHLAYMREDAAAVETAAATNYWGSGRTIYIVRRYATEQLAERDFRHLASVKFTASPIGHEPSAAIQSRRSNVADDQFVQCGYLLDDFKCAFGGRYQEFTVFFNASVGEGDLSPGQFNAVLEYIDAAMGGLLYGAGSGGRQTP